MPPTVTEGSAMIGYPITDWELEQIEKSASDNKPTLWWQHFVVAAAILISTK